MTKSDLNKLNTQKLRSTLKLLHREWVRLNAAINSYYDNPTKGIEVQRLFVKQGQVTSNIFHIRKLLDDKINGGLR